MRRAIVTAAAPLIVAATASKTTAVNPSLQPFISLSEFDRAQVFHDALAYRDTSPESTLSAPVIPMKSYDGTLPSFVAACDEISKEETQFDPHMATSDILRNLSVESMFEAAGVNLVHRVIVTRCGWHLAELENLDVKSKNVGKELVIDVIDLRRRSHKRKEEEQQQFPSTNFVWIPMGILALGAVVSSVLSSWVSPPRRR